METSSGVPELACMSDGVGRRGERDVGRLGRRRARALLAALGGHARLPLATRKAAEPKGVVERDVLGQASVRGRDRERRATRVWWCSSARAGRGRAELDAGG